MASLSQIGCPPLQHPGSRGDSVMKPGANRLGRESVTCTIATGLAEDVLKLAVVGAEHHIAALQRWRGDAQPSIGAAIRTAASVSKTNRHPACRLAPRAPTETLSGQ